MNTTNVNFTEMEAEYAISIGNNGRITAVSNSNYNFGLNDFTVTGWFMTSQPGTLISRKESAGTPGWLLVLKPNGVIKLATDNGAGFYEVNSDASNALDGQWHHVAAVRNQGAINIYLDGAPINVTPGGSLPSPLNVSNNLGITIGGTEQQQEPYNQFTGNIEDIGLWSRALSQDEIITVMFGPVSDSFSGIAAFWKFNNNFNDSSPVGNTATASGAVSFLPICGCVFSKGENHYQYCCFDNLNANYYAQSGDTSNQLISRTQIITISDGTPILLGGITDGSDVLNFPVGAMLTLTGPNGVVLNSETNTDDLFIHMNGSSLFAFTVKNPQPGNWTLTITIPQDSPFVVSFQALPSLDPVNTCMNALKCCYPQLESGYASAGNDRIRLASVASFWGTLGEVVGFGIAVVAVAAFAVGSVALLPAAGAVIIGLSIAQVSFVIDTSAQLGSLREGARSIANAIGFDPNVLPDVGLALNGGYIQIPDNHVYNFGTNDFTTEGWIRPTKPGPLFGRKGTAGGSSADAGFLFQVNENGIISLVTDNGFGYYLVNSRNTNAFDGRWHHIAGVRQNGVITIYFDGQPIDSTVSNSLPSPLNVSNDLNLLIGSVEQNQQKYRNLYGTIADVRIWNVARSRDQIKGHMMSSPSTESTGLIGLWPLTTSEANDISKTANSGQLVGDTSWSKLPGQQLSQIQVGRNAAGGYEYLGEHTFVCAMKTGGQTQPYPNNVNIFFDCAGGHGDDVNHSVPVTLGSLIVYGRPDDLIRMAQGSGPIDPNKKVYGSGNEWGQGTAGINATGTINREGFCHQITNRLLWACVWPNSQVTLANAVPEVRGYYTTWLWTGTYGKSWASIINGKQTTFAEWCAMNDFPIPPSEDTSMYNDLRAFEPRHRKILMRHAIELQETANPLMSLDELTEIKSRFERNALSELPETLLSTMGLMTNK